MLFLALDARFPVFLELTEMYPCYYMRFLFSFSVRVPLWGTSVCNFACLFRLLILLACFASYLSLVRSCFVLFFKYVLFGENIRKVRVQNKI